MYTKRTSERQHFIDDPNYCNGCGCYTPKRLNGDPTTCGCGRTPPTGDLPPNVYACPTCFGLGESAWGCWGTSENPHEHCYMRPVYDLLKEQAHNG